MEGHQVVIGEEWEITQQGHEIVTAQEWEGKEHAHLSRQYEERKEEWLELLSSLEESKEATDFNISNNLRLLPDELGGLRCLETLYMSCPGLRRIPATIGQLQNLLELSLFGCPNLVSIPPEIGDLKRLKKLTIVASYRLRNIPPSIGRLQSLETLELASLRKLTRLPDSLGDLSNLRVLYMYQCDQLTALPDSVSKLDSSLQRLSAFWCENLRLLPSQVVQLKNLRVLFLYNSPVLPRLPDNICEMTSLSQLILKDCVIDSREVLMATVLPPRLRGFSSLLLCEHDHSQQADNKFMLQFLKRNPYVKHVGLGEYDEDDQEIRVEVSQDVQQLLTLNRFRAILKGGHLSVSPSQFPTVLAMINNRLDGDTAGQVAVIYGLLQIHSPSCWLGLEETTQG